MRVGSSEREAKANAERPTPNSDIRAKICRYPNPAMEEIMARTTSRGGSPRAGGRRGVAGRHKTGGSTRRVSKSGGKRPGVTKKKGGAKKRKALRTRNVGKGRVRGRQSGGGGKASSFTARPIGRTLGVALAGESPPPGERGAWGFGKAKPSVKSKKQEVGSKK